MALESWFVAPPADHWLIASIERGFNHGGIAALEEATRVPTGQASAHLPRIADIGDLVILRHLEPPQLRLFSRGQEVPHDRYYERRITRRRLSYRQVVTADLRRELEDGATLIIDAVDTIEPRVREAAHVLQWHMNELVQVNAYLTLPGSHGFNVHWDDHDVLVVQVEGEKHWQIWGPTRHDPMYRDSVIESVAPSVEPRIRLKLVENEMLFIPRGWWHSAETVDTPSLHLTFGISRSTGIDWLESLADEMRNVESARSNLTSLVHGGRTDEVLGEFRDRLEMASPASYRAGRARRSTARRYFRVPFNAEMDRRIVCVADLPPHVVQTDVAVEIESMGKRLRFAKAALDSLTQLLTPVPVRVDGIESATISASQTAEVANELVHHGLCTWV